MYTTLSIKPENPDSRGIYRQALRNAGFEFDETILFKEDAIVIVNYLTNTVRITSSSIIYEKDRVLTASDFSSAAAEAIRLALEHTTITGAFAELPNLQRHEINLASFTQPQPPETSKEANTSQPPEQRRL
ncbi:MAG: hypothetical protein V1659_00775 [Candidatus Woesearchaeota archaeon]